MSDDEKDKNSPRVVLSETAVCPHCKGGILIQKIRRNTQPGVKAIYEEELKVEKDVQQTLE